MTKPPTTTDATPVRPGRAALARATLALSALARATLALPALARAALALSAPARAALALSAPARAALALSALAITTLLGVSPAGGHGWLRDGGHAAHAEGEAEDPASTPARPGLFADELALPDTLGVGRVADDVGLHLPRLEALSTWLSDRLGPVGFARALPVVARDHAQMKEYLRTGVVDLVSEAPFAALGLQEDAGATPLLLEKRGGRAFAGSVLLVRVDSTVQAVTDLAGKRLVLESPSSTTGFLLPVALLRRAGLRLVHLENREEAAPPGSLAWAFSRDPSRDPFEVARGAVDVAVMGDTEWRQFQAREPVVSRDLRVLAETEKVPRGLLMTGPLLDGSRRVLLEELLLHAADEGPGKAMLERYGELDGFDRLDAGFEEQLQALRDLRSVLADEVR